MISHFTFCILLEQAARQNVSYILQEYGRKLFIDTRLLTNASFQGVLIQNKKDCGVGFGFTHDDTYFQYTTVSDPLVAASQCKSCFFFSDWVDDVAFHACGTCVWHSDHCLWRFTILPRRSELFEVHQRSKVNCYCVRDFFRTDAR